MRKIQEDKRFSRLPSEVREKLAGRRLNKDDLLFCLFNARSRDHAWLAEVLWEKFLWRSCDKNDCLFLMERCPNLEFQAYNKFLGLHPTNSELRYASVYARNNEIAALIDRAVRHNNSVIELKKRTVDRFDRGADFQQIAATGS